MTGRLRRGRVGGGRVAGLALASAVLGLLAALTGCAGIPSSSSPVRVSSVHAGDSTPGPGAQVLPPGPAVGADPQSIVRGFLTASAEGTDARYSVARSYLSAAASAGWDDHAETTIYQAVNVGSGAHPDVVTASIAVVATVDAEGSYTPTKSREYPQFRLVQVHRQWRISSLPNGLLIDNKSFGGTFNPVTAYFLDPTHRYVVPDPRFFELSSDALSNRAIQALMKGPSSWLAPAVQTEIPAGATLRRGVHTSGSTIVVDLHNLGHLDQEQLRAMCAQIVFTLGDNASVQILADGQPLELGAVPAVQTPDTWRAMNPAASGTARPVYLTLTDGVYRRDSNQVPGSAPPRGQSIRSVGVSVDNTSMATVSHGKSGDSLLMGTVGEKLTPMVNATSFTPPTWGAATDSVWTIRNGDTPLQVFLSGTALARRSPEVSRLAPVSEFRLSPDGTRVAVIGADHHLYVGVVSISGGATSIVNLRKIAPQTSGAQDVAWTGAGTVLLLAQSSDSPSTAALWQLDVVGYTVQEIPVTNLPLDANGIAGAPNSPTIISAPSGGGTPVVGQLSDGSPPSYSQLNGLYGAAPVYPG